MVVQQKGVFRSNCMDCLDRTNVIQSLLARRSLQSQLQVFEPYYFSVSLNSKIGIENLHNVGFVSNYIP